MKTEDMRRVGRLNFDIKKIIEITKELSPKSFVNDRNELIVEPKNNIYFRLDGVNSELELKRKVISWLSRPSCKGVSEYWQKKILGIVNGMLETKFTKDQMMDIYTYLGNDCNKELCVQFIESGYDLALLKR